MKNDLIRLNTLSKKGMTNLNNLASKPKLIMNKIEDKVVTPFLEREELGVSLINWWIILVFFLSLTSCKKVGLDKTETPKLLITEDKMTSILVDLHIAEAAILSANKAQKDSIGGVYFKQVFEMHKIQDSLFYQNLEIISKNPKMTEAIYEKVIEKIEKLNIKNNKSTVEKEEKKSDKKKK